MLTNEKQTCSDEEEQEWKDEHKADWSEKIIKNNGKRRRSEINWIVTYAINWWPTPSISLIIKVPSI